MRPGASLELDYRRISGVTAVRRSLRRARRVYGRLRHAHDLWYRLGFSWNQAWRIAGTWH